MKHVLLVTLILLASSLCANTTPALQKSQYAQEIYFSFEITERSELEQLTRIVDIDNVKGNIVYAYAIPEELAKLKKLGYKIELLPVSGSSKDLTMATTIAEMANWDRYPTYDVYIAMMYQFASDYPSICRLENIGYSIENREILTVKISDNPDIEEDEPEFFYTAQMHGDEIVTYIMMLRLIDYILSHYGTDAEITEMVNEIEIWINPLANPDGTYHGGNNTVSGARRYLANNVDPNRNFPDPEDGPHPDGHPWAPETIMMMDFADEHSLIHSANFHSGAEVVNYPWDTWYTLHADDDWYIDISKAYADTVFANSTGGYLQSVSTNGYIRGCLWYVIAGGRQDYMNYFQACREVTIELSDTKLLSSNLLPAHWTYNKRSFIKYIQNVYYGIRGVVTDTLGNPLNAMITVVDHDFDNSEVFTDPEVGDYHRMLLPGTYDIIISKESYAPRLIKNINVVDTGAVVVNAVLDYADIVNVTGNVTDAETHSPIQGAVIEILDTQISPDTTDFYGNYSFENVLEDIYTFRVSADGYPTITKLICLSNNHIVDFQLIAPYLFWDFEDNNGGFTSNSGSGWQWGEPSAGDITAYSGVKVWAINLSGFYANSVHWYLDSPAIQLGNNPMLEFYHQHNFEESSTLWDGGNVSISTNGGSSFGLLTPVGGYDGNISALSQQGYGGTRTEWTLAQFSLAPYANQEIMLRWHFGSDSSVHDYYGWYIDDVAIIELVGTDDPAPGNNELVLGQNFPNPFRSSTTIAFSLPKNLSESTLKIYNLKGQLVSQTSLEGTETSFTWNGKDMGQKPVSSGVYFYQIQSKDYSSEIKKMIYLQ